MGCDEVGLKVGVRVGGIVVGSFVVGCDVDGFEVGTAVGLNVVG